MRTAVGWGVREGFLEELAWCTMVDNPGGKNSKGQGLLVEELGRFEGQRETSVAGAVRETAYILWGPHIDGGDEG